MGFAAHLAFAAFFFGILRGYCTQKDIDVAGSSGNLRWRIGGADACGEDGHQATYPLGFKGMMSTPDYKKEVFAYENPYHLSVLLQPSWCVSAAVGTYLTLSDNRKHSFCPKHTLNKANNKSL